jgi:hypothetical protein
VLLPFSFEITLRLEANEERIKRAGFHFGAP